MTRRLGALIAAGGALAATGALMLPGAAGATSSLPTLTGALQQEVLHTKPGYYIQACFMNTLDGREHTQLGMLRPIRVK